MANSCIVVRKNLGPSQCDVMPGLLKAFFITPRNFRLSAADSITKAGWQSALFDTPGTRIHLTPKFNDFKDESEAAVYAANPLSKLFVRDGRYEFLASFAKDIYFHKSLGTHNSRGGERIIYVDMNNNFWGQTDSDGNFLGYSLEMIQREKMKFNDGSNPSLTLLRVTLADATEFDDNAAFIDASGFYPQLLELVDVDLAQVGASTSSLIKVTVKVSSDGTSVDGLVAADFDVKDSSGAPIVHTVTQDSDGIYHLASATLFSAGDTVNLVAASALTIEGYESTGKITVT